MDRSIAFHHFGCKVNFAEASSLSRQFRELGYEIRDHREQADIYVISTCVVTGVAEKKCRAAIRQAHRQNPAARIAVIGCFPELKPGEIGQMEGVDIVLGHTGKFTLPEAVSNLFRDEVVREEKHYHGGLAAPVDTGPAAFIPSYSYGDRTRSFLKIQDGCDYQCSYCTIPLARGGSRSDSIENVLGNARDLIDRGIREIVLTGVNIGDFGNRREGDFLTLIRQLDRLDGEVRFRISSIEPDLLSDEIIDFVAGSRHFQPHFHIPLQSGSDRILGAMRRRYRTGLYAGRVDRIRARMPLACIAADVITGFPGETVTETNETERFLESLAISYLHVFTYSRRDNTVAAAMADAVSEKEKKRRSDALHRLSEEKKASFYRANAGLPARVLFESDHRDGTIQGFTGNYVRVKAPFNASLINRIIPVTLGEPCHDGLLNATLHET